MDMVLLVLLGHRGMLGGWDEIFLAPLFLEKEI
jgi:hypothetical protein